MKVRILYFEGCPNHPPAVDLVRRVANKLGVQVTVEEVEVRNQEDAERLRFFGSPTIQVDGVDVEPAARGRTDYAYSCRMYGSSGLPPDNVIRSALQSSKDGTIEHRPEQPRENNVGSRSALAAVCGSVVAAIAASACCWLPPLLIGFGVSAAGIGASFAALRPYMLGGAFLLLATGFYLTYVRKTACCEPSTGCGTANGSLQRINRGMLWLGLISVMVFAFFPKYLGLGVSSSSISLPADIPHVTLTVDGMSCEACSKTIRDALKDIPGVVEASVSYQESKVVVATEPAGADREALVQAVERAGFHVKNIERDR